MIGFMRGTVPRRPESTLGARTAAALVAAAIDG
jgi:hypothetical protein